MQVFLQFFQDTFCVLLPCVSPHTRHVAVQFATQLALEVARHTHSCSSSQVLRLHVLPHTSLGVVQPVTIVALENKDTSILIVFQPHVLHHAEPGLVHPFTLLTADILFLQ